jgi:hypothetical protein
MSSTLCFEKYSLPTTVLHREYSVRSAHWYIEKLVLLITQYSIAAQGPVLRTRLKI